MDGRLWTRLYRHVRWACKGLTHVRRVGRPKVYGTDEVLRVWAFAAWMDWPISVTHDKLKAGAVGWWMRRHWSRPGLGAHDVRGPGCYGDADGSL